MKIVLGVLFPLIFLIFVYCFRRQIGNCISNLLLELRHKLRNLKNRYRGPRPNPVVYPQDNHEINQFVPPMIQNPAIVNPPDHPIPEQNQGINQVVPHINQNPAIVHPPDHLIPEMNPDLLHQMQAQANLEIINVNVQ